MADSALLSEIQLLSLSSTSSSTSTSRQDANENDNVDLTEKARAAVYAGPPRRTIGNDNAIFDHDDPKIKEDVIRMIVQYLQDEGYVASIMTIQDETSVRFAESLRNRSHFKRIKAAILDGEWVEMEKLVQKTPLKDHKHFIYAVYKQQYLELIEQLEYQKAFALLTKKLKPLEQMGSLHNEFKDLCYLLTCKSIQDAAFFKTWEGVASSREKLVDQFSSMLEIENNDIAVARHEVQPQRLLHLLKQAVRYQIEFSRYHPKVVPSVPTDNTLRVWDVEDGRCVRVLGDGELGSGGGHTSRIWDVTSSSSGDFIASASGDSTVKFWNLRGSNKTPCSATLAGHEGDVYSVKYHQSNNYVVTGGYDKTVKLWDARTGVLLRTFSGHKSSVSRVIFNPLGNLVISGSKDSTLKFWDLVSGVCVKTYSSHLGEVTSVEMNKAGSFLLSGSKDNSNRLWDVRLARPIRRFKGHQNTSKNFVRASFGPDESLVVGGSEDGFVYIWDTATGEILQRLGSHSPESHTDIAYRAVWNAHQSLLVSCSHDCTVKTWWYDEQQMWDQDDDI